MKRGQTDYNFLIAVDKPSGISSHDLVFKVRKILGEGRIGHNGTLDPLASGVMILGVGSGARLNRYLEDCNKQYVVKAVFGQSSNTYDCEGILTDKIQVDEKILNWKFAELYLKKLVGEHIQKPPAFSAIKINGKPAYKAARQNKDVDLPERKINIFATELLSVDTDSWTFKVDVSKGTYIRSIVHDIGCNLGCGAYVDALQRTKVGNIKLSDCYELDGLEQDYNLGEINVLNAAKLLDFPIVEATEEFKNLIDNGSKIECFFDDLSFENLHNNQNDSQAKNEDSIFQNIQKKNKISFIDKNKLLAIYEFVSEDSDICKENNPQKSKVVLKCLSKFNGPIKLGI